MMEAIWSLYADAIDPNQTEEREISSRASIPTPDAPMPLREALRLYGGSTALPIPPAEEELEVVKSRDVFEASQAQPQSMAWRLPPARTSLEMQRETSIVVAPRKPELGVLYAPERRGRVFDSLKVAHSRILELLAEDNHAVVAVCSAFGGEGKTTVALALAEMLADAFPRQILLIDGHLKRPQLHNILDVQASPGMKDCLENGAVVSGSIQWGGLHWVMPAGEGTPLPGTVTWEGERGLLRTLQALFRVTIVDMPATLSYAQEAALLSRWADGVVWVAKSSSGSADEVIEAVEVVGKDKLLGVVLNKRRSSLPGWLERLL